MVNVRESHEIVYKLTREDAESAYGEAMSLLTKHAKAVEPRRAKIARIVVHLWFTVGFTLILFGEHLPLLAAFAAASILSFALVWGMFKLGHAAQRRVGLSRFIETASAGANSSTEHMVVVNADGLFKHSKNLMVTFFWHYVREVTMTDRNIIFIMDPAQAPNVVFVPRRVFATDAEAKEFYSVANAYRGDSAVTEPVQIT